MCPLLLALLCFIIGLLPLGIHSRAMTPPTRALTHRTPKLPKSSPFIIKPTASDASIALDNSIAQGDRHIIWRALLHKEPPPSLFNPFLDRSYNELREASASRRGSRGRRHANSAGGRGHGQLMRVGCVLGTCQVQNLSHRLYQLIGQSGREDSSPINPRSPHSYG